MIWVLRAFEGANLVIGAAIAIASLTAYRRTRSPELAYLGAGFVLVSVGAAAAGLLYEVLTHDLLDAWTTSASIDALGFLLILYSILRPRHGAPGPLAPVGPPPSGGDDAAPAADGIPTAENHDR